MRSRLRFGALLGLVLFVHAAVLGWFLYRDSTRPPQMAQAEAVPVEIVQEPPPPPEQPKQPEQPKPPPPPLDEKPATSAPRAPSPVTVDTKASAAKTEAPKAEAPLRDGQPPPAKAAAAPPQPAAPDRQEAAAAKPPDDTDAEPLDKAQPEADKTPDARDAKAKPEADAAKADAARQLAGLSNLPDYSFTAAAKMTDFPAGTEDNRYLAVVYAKVMSKNRYRASAAARRGARGTVSVSFVVDFRGDVPYQAVSESSGQSDLDALAMAAVALRRALSAAARLGIAATDRAHELRPLNAAPARPALALSVPPERNQGP